MKDPLPVYYPEPERPTMSVSACASYDCFSVGQHATQVTFLRLEDGTILRGIAPSRSSRA
ncbi:MAG TPA: hypothetical protein VM580_03260 [Labilithrix sp.]|nr:hypothetical protein [Labilithrix sp.]